MIIWITKYALTKGIYTLNVKECKDGIVKGPGTWDFYHGEGKDWHRTPEAATNKALEMRRKKIEWLKRQIAKLEKIKFI